MILFYGRAEDTPLTRCIETTAELGVDHRFIDQAALRHHDLSVHYGPDGAGGTVVLGGEHLDLRDVTAVYARPLELPAGGSHAAEFNDAFVEWLDLTDALVVNRPSAMHSNTSKPFQARLIGAAGFTVPDTLVTDDPAEVTAFRARHGRVVFKSVSGIRSIVTELDDRTGARLELVRALPTQFQAYVPGVDVRVHVVGGAVFPTEIVSEALDYRYARRSGLSAELTAVELPDPVAKRCVALAELLDLSLCGIDLRRRPDGEYVCFEVNPMPAYSYFEDGGGQPIGRTLAELLREAPCRRSGTTSPR
ncbi:ATP-grasp domain-containing protein [Amycolatopsis tolypomycina]|uniref:ATP-grasp domain-containing protein n=1 Tax=Amycolatopsis tolypomycina TaxID=208445 RepID=A0A1H4VJE5_9PSEU|nr:alpha-L-glutamate ligase [Amycolatopsis tolypomycina]SEC81083.1 ATP-grasp domain-containing protein [Amycolatopsis tolypomycina]